MKFCPSCNNLLYYIERENMLYETCRACDHTQIYNERIIQTNIYKSTSANSSNQNAIDSTTNKFIVFDNTLPRTIKKQCPNASCPSAKDKNLQEAVFFNDTTTMKLIYVCTACCTQWKYS